MGISMEKSTKFEFQLFQNMNVVMNVKMNVKNNQGLNHKL